MLIGPAAPVAAPLPEDGGPWAAVVESVGSPRDGDQVARLRLLARRGRGPGRGDAAGLPGGDGRRPRRGRRPSLRPPPDDDPYGAYLRRTGAAGSARRARAASSSRRHPSAPGARDGRGDAVQRALPEPEAGLAAGILIGLRERVDRTLAADFATAGVSHVVAISGWNIAIVAGARRGGAARPPEALVAVGSW